MKPTIRQDRNEEAARVVDTGSHLALVDNALSLASPAISISNSDFCRALLWHTTQGQPLWSSSFFESLERGVVEREEGLTQSGT